MKTIVGHFCNTPTKIGIAPCLFLFLLFYVQYNLNNAKTRIKIYIVHEDMYVINF